MTSYSLRRRLIGWLLAATAVIGLAALADTWREARRTAQSVSDRVLTGSALAIAERVTVDESEGLEVDIPYSSLEMLTSTAQDQVFYRVDGPGGVFLTGYEDLPVLVPGGAGVALADDRYGNVPIRIATLAREVSTGAQSIPFTVTVAESTLARDALARTILLRSALRLLGMIVGAAVIVWVAVTLALRPLDRLGDAIADRSPDDLSPIREDTPDEVAGLLGAFNSFMQRLDRTLAALRHFTGNASHQLRTPMAVVRTQLALVTRSTDPAEVRDAVRKADAALARAERVLAQLLVLARVDAAAGRREQMTADLAQVARDVTAEMVPQATRQGVDLGYDGPTQAQVNAEPVLLSELIRNLADNAIIHGGQGGVVTVRVRPMESEVMLEVEDSGPGLPPEKAAMLEAADPPQRDGLPSADTRGGYGLGLAVVREIAALFGAVTRAVPASDGHGSMISVKFNRGSRA